ncbi:hypothetical protein [Aliivibrio kagoshimensis]|uniref:hypothetical protein n=1 Tax=Aliivibrio kagoshimensis TaxID=2910230 RepID=UPI003D138AE9
MFFYSRFWQIFVGVWILFFLLFIAAFELEVYRFLPFFSFIAYGVLIVGLLSALTNAHYKIHFIVSSVSLILLGTFASIDMLSAKEEVLALWQHNRWLYLDKNSIDDYTQVLIILVNIFTGSLAANTLFHGLVMTKRKIR